MDSVILCSPIIIVAICVALAMWLVSLFVKKAKNVCLWASVIALAASLTCALAAGATLVECAAVCGVFFVLYVIRYAISGGKL